MREAIYTTMGHMSDMSVLLYYATLCPIVAVDVRFAPLWGLMIYIKCKYADMSELSDSPPSLWITLPLCPQLVHNCGYPVDNYIYRTYVLLSTYRFAFLSIVDLSTYRPAKPISLHMSTMSNLSYIVPIICSSEIHLEFTYFGLKRVSDLVVLDL